MHIIRIKYIKGKQVKYISHLDTLRILDRCIRRSGIPVSFSKGFNPRPNMNFALPTSVGISSLCEFAEIELDTQINKNIFIKTLNDNLPEGIKILEAEYVWHGDADIPNLQKNKSLMSLVRQARYNIVLKFEILVDTNEINDVFNLGEMIVTKSSPKKTSDVDIKPMIIQYKISDLYEQDGLNLVDINVLCLAGSSDNLKPELIIDAIKKYANLDIYDYEIEKEEVILE